MSSSGPWSKRYFEWAFYSIVRQLYAFSNSSDIPGLTFIGQGACSPVARQQQKWSMGQISISNWAISQDWCSTEPRLHPALVPVCSPHEMTQQPLVSRGGCWLQPSSSRWRPLEKSPDYEPPPVRCLLSSSSRNTNQRAATAVLFGKNYYGASNHVSEKYLRSKLKPL